MQQQSYQPLRFVYLLVALFAALLLIARPVMADEEANDPANTAYYKGKSAGEKAGKEAGQKANWTDLTPPVPEVPESPNDIEGSDNKQHYKDGYTDGYRDGYNEGWKSEHPVLTPVKVIWDLISHWLKQFFPNNPSTTTVQGMS
ncbi:Uncharacterised protein [Streptococcus pyogenes]|uniref:hypothetical protein n=1 Tax=Streptococcus pyogenes TaxID=1314 RepID=UPI00109CC1F9|nr:hypothetical protein [Streptococcus pyogenes]VHG61304.1 Uncharacterised protein [Streptococcus pyogenes]